MNLDVRFELLDKIGSGSYATVYRARDKELGREVAVKQIHQQFLEDPRTLDRYWAEAQLLASLQHPNIVTIFDIVRERGWLIMELMQGSLKQRLAGRQMDLRSLRTAVAHSLRALKYLHERGVIHGDIKPGNMMIDHRKRVKIGDFGLARRVSDDDGSLLKGTAKYIAPEVVSDEFGEIGPHSDLYALGFSAYELMCGSENFEDLFPGLSAFGRDKQAAWMMWHAAPDRRLPEISRVLDGVPSDLAHVIQKLVEKDPKHRYWSADEALSDLNVDIKLVATGPSPEEDVETEEAPVKSGSRRTLAYVAVAMSAIVCSAMLFMPQGSDSTSGPAKSTLGVVRKVDPATGEMEYENPKTGVPALVSLPEGSRIELIEPGADSRYILPRDILGGDWVEIERGGGPLSLTVSRPTTSIGSVQAVDPANRTIEVAVQEGAIRDDLVLNVPDGAKLSLNSQKAQLSDLAAGDRVEMRHLLDPAGKTGHVLSELTASRRSQYSAFVDRVDAEQRKIHLSFGPGGGPVRVLPLADDVQLTLKSGGSLEFTDLRVGDRLTVESDDRVYRLEVIREDLQLSGTIFAIDLNRKELGVLTSDGTKHTLVVADDAEITLGLQPAGLDDLRLEIDSVTVAYREDSEGARHAVAIDANRGERHDRWGLLIGTQAFADRAVPKLPFAVSDAQLVYETLTNRYAMDPQWTARVLDRTRNDTTREIDRFLKQVGEQAQVVVYIATQAYVGPDGVVYLACSDFRLDNMPGTGLPLDEVIAQVEQCGAKRKMLLLDIVHATKDVNPELQPALPELLYQVKTPIVETDVIGASSSDERGHDLRAERRGAFARLVSQGMAGAADDNRDLDITPDELYAYLLREFAVLSLPGGVSQTPFRLEGASANQSP